MKRPPSDRGQGRKPIPRPEGEELIRVSVSFTQADMDYLKSRNPRNVSAAIRTMIEEARSS